MSGVYKAKDLVVVIEKRRIKVGVKGQALLIDGDFPKDVKLDDCSQTRDNVKPLHRNLSLLLQHCIAAPCAREEGV